MEGLSYWSQLYKPDKITISSKIYGDPTVVLTTTTMHKYSILLTSKTQFI